MNESVFGYEGEQCHVPRLFNRLCQVALVMGADTGDTAWDDFAALGDKLREKIHIFVIDVLDPRCRQGARFSPSSKSIFRTASFKHHTILSLLN